MARMGLGVGLAGALISLFLLLQVFLTTDNDPPISANFNARGKDWTGTFAPDNNVFLLGAGKADITGYD